MLKCVVAFVFFQVENSEMSDYQVDWGMPDSSIMLHPLYFAKCLTKVVFNSFSNSPSYIFIKELLLVPNFFLALFCKCHFMPMFSFPKSYSLHNYERNNKGAYT